MEIVNTLISRIEFLSRQNNELSRRLEIYRNDYLARQNKPKPRKRATRA
jgi:hypothetical protein